MGTFVGENMCAVLKMIIQTIQGAVEKDISEWSDFEKTIVYSCYGIAKGYEKRLEADMFAYLRSIPYAEYLKTDHWQCIRKMALENAGHVCQLCNANNVELHVHHRSYDNRGWENKDDVIVLCAICHGKFHDKDPESGQQAR